MCYINYVLHIHTKCSTEQQRTQHKCQPDPDTYTAFCSTIDCIQIELARSGLDNNVLHTSAQYDHKISINRNGI